MEPFLPSKPRQKKPRLQPLGASLSDIVKPALAARGMTQSSLISHWVEIVGEPIAAFARPEQLQWPPRGDKRDPDGKSAPATLVLRIDGAYALEASHLASRIMARVNAHLGWRCVHKIAFRQGPLAPLTPARKKPAPPSAAAQAAAEEACQGVEDEALRAALTRLGARVIDRGGKR
jgi:hypothetical protein